MLAGFQADSLSDLHPATSRSRASDRGQFMIDQDIVVDAHKWSTHQRERYYAKDIVGCFYCEDQFQAADIEDWCDERGVKRCTALCPSCGIDSVISISDTLKIGVGREEFDELLSEMKKYWFE